jgi:Uma2 family endonuclease
MSRTMANLPRTAVEVFKLLPEGVYCQVIENVIYMSPAPTFNHQDTVAEITTHIRNYLKKKNLGKCVASPVDVFLDKNNAFQPDIIFLNTENLEASGVKEYFIVDPGTKDVSYWYLADNKFDKKTPVKGKIISRLLKKTFKF